MAEENKTESSRLAGAWPVTIVLAILASLVFTHWSPYHEERPSARPFQTRYAAAQDVDARLWQDPFAAVYGEDEETPAANISFELNQKGKTLQLMGAISQAGNSLHTPDKIYTGKNFDDIKDITVLAVTLFGGPYQEDAEQRMRWRYAVLSALANQNWTPEDDRHIGYFHPAPYPPMGLQKRVPFEWWSLDNHRKVLLLWVDEFSLLEFPAAKLKALLSQASQKSQNRPAFHYAVVGPNTSTVLRDLLKEVESAKKSDPGTQCKDKTDTKSTNSKLGEIKGAPIVYYSAAATASNERLLEGIATENKSVTGYLSNGGVKLYRTTATEREMMDVLVHELNLRQVKAHHVNSKIMTCIHDKQTIPQDKQKVKEDHIVILSEWDTVFGRAMPEAFKTVWGNDGRDKDGETLVHVYSYMRGLDGKLPDKDGKNASAPEKKSDSKDKSDGDTDTLIELPEGQYQKDYLRRLASSILKLDQELKDRGNKNGVAAIGVLGSDVHDKLLILEALRQHFPHKLFFTTDLDAVYSHPAKWPQTHNLLVASAFDLKLRDELQVGIPPFRDSYQTALFLAAQMALKEERECIANTKAHNGGKCIVDQIGKPPPRLFEIGRNGPVPLPTSKDEDKFFPKPVDTSDKPKCSRTDWLACLHEIKDRPLLPRSFEFSNSSATHSDDSNTPECSWRNWSSCNKSVQPRIFTTFQLNWTWGDVTVIVVLALLICWVSWWVRMRMGQIAIGVSATLFLAICFTHFWNNYFTLPDAEPFYWNQGVSAWPSQLLRLSACLFAAGFFIWGHKRIRKMQDELTVQKLTVQRGGKIQPTFALPDKTEKLERCEVLFVGSWEKNKDREVATVSPDDLWKKYLGYCRNRKGAFPASFLRVLFNGLIFIVLAYLFIMQSDFPNVPIRGDSARHWYYVILIAAVSLTIFLTMWVVQHARLCERLIHHLSEKPSLWNTKAIHWAQYDNKVAPECVNDWLDIQLVVRLTETMQQLIWGPMVCLALLMLARSSAIDDWDFPWGLILVMIAMILYAISVEVYLQLGAKHARKKANDQLTDKIKAQRNLKRSDEVAIKRIEAEIERIRKLSDGAFRPWYELPLLQAFGGLSAFVVALEKYFSWVLETRTF